MSEKSTPPEDDQPAGLPDVDELLAWLNSDPVRELAIGRAHHITLVGERRYQGMAAMRGRDGYRRIRLNVAKRPSVAELALTLCHELAHYAGKAMSGHTPQWREAFAEIVREAGRLGIFTDEEVTAGLDAALHGPSSAGLHWREKRAEFEQVKRDNDNAALAPLLAAGLQVGSRIRFSVRGENLIAEVTRINRRSIRADSLDGKRWHRMPFSMVEAVL